MSDLKKPRERVRAGGRSERIRLAVANACLDILNDESPDITHSEVSVRAGISRATVYRWWPTVSDILREGLTLHNESIAVPDTGAWATDVADLVREMVRFSDLPIERSLSVLIASGKAPDLRSGLDHAFDRVMEKFEVNVGEARLRGEVRPEANADVLLQMISGPIFLITVLLDRSPTAQEVEDLIDFVVAGTESR